jgi:hypothetical protein
VLEVERLSPLLLVIDLTGLSFIDSTGLSVLLAAAERARSQERRLIVVRPPLPALRVFTLTRVDAGMECIDDPLDVTVQRDDRGRHPRHRAQALATTGRAEVGAAFLTPCWKA